MNSCRANKNARSFRWPLFGGAFPFLRYDGRWRRAHRLLRLIVDPQLSEEDLKVENPAIGLRSQERGEGSRGDGCDARVSERKLSRIVQAL